MSEPMRFGYEKVKFVGTPVLTGDVLRVDTEHKGEAGVKVEPVAIDGGCDLVIFTRAAEYPTAVKPFYDRLLGDVS